jgi:hypothetical protein
MLILLASSAMIAEGGSAANYWQECQIETATICGPEGCRNVQPTLKLYLGDYEDTKGRPKSYYYRCRRDGPCDEIRDPWVGENESYRAFVAPAHGVISRVGPDGKVTDVATLNDQVLISRGTCWSSEPYQPAK